MARYIVQTGKRNSRFIITNGKRYIRQADKWMAKSSMSNGKGYQISCKMSGREILPNDIVKTVGILCKLYFSWFQSRKRF